MALNHIMKQILTKPYINECLKQARYYEFCKDCDRALEALKPIWNDIEQPPDLDDLDEKTACEILLVCGGIISSYGTAHQKNHYLESANDMLSNARDLAISIGERDLIAESEKQIAVSYWRNGRYDNAVAYSNTVLTHYTEHEQLTNKICLLTQANLLMLHVGMGNAELAFEIFEKIKFFVDDNEDLWLKTVFYTQAAAMYVFTDKFAAAIPFLEKAIEFATLTNNDNYLGASLNNLANAYVNIGDTGSAAEYINQAAQHYLQTNQIFPYAVILETKSQILLQSGDLKNALPVIDESIAILSKGENYEYLCESLWTRFVILLKSGERYQAMRQYNDLISAVKKHLDAAAEESFIRKFDKLIFPIYGESFDDKEDNFRRHLLDEALEKGGGLVTATAKILNVDHQRLSKMVGKFPDLKEKHKVKFRTRRGNSPVKKEKTSIVETSFAFRLKSDSLKSINLKKKQVVKVEIMNLDELDFSKPVVIKDSNQVFHCGFLIDMFGIFAFQDENGDIDKTFVSQDVMLAGQIVGVFDANADCFVPLNL